MKKRILAAVLTVVMACSMFAAISIAAPSTVTVKYDSFGETIPWGGWLSALNFGNEGEASFTSVVNPERKNVLQCYKDKWLGHNGQPAVDINDAQAFTNAMMTYVPDATATNPGPSYTNGKTVWQYMQEDYGAKIHALDAGKWQAYDLWNTKVRIPVTEGVRSYTYTPADAQTEYTVDSYQKAIDALKVYLQYANETNVFKEPEDMGRFAAQNARWEALNTAINELQLAPTATPVVDLHGVTPAPGVDDKYGAPFTQIALDRYNMIDMPSVLIHPEVVAFGTALRDGIAAGKSEREIAVPSELQHYGQKTLLDAWDLGFRNIAGVQNGNKAWADQVMKHEAFWPAGKVVIDPAQIYYKADGYKRVWDQYVIARDDAASKASSTAAYAACMKLARLIPLLEVAQLPFTPEQKVAFDNLNTYIPFYNARLERMLLDETKASPEYKAYADYCAEANKYVALDWVNGTSDPAAYPSVETLYALCAKDANGGHLEETWQAVRLVAGIDAKGWDHVVYGKLQEYKNSGLYTEASLAEVEDEYWYWARLYRDDRNNTDAMAKEALDAMEALLVLKPVDPKPVNELKFKGASLALQSSIGVQFKADVALLDEYTDIYAEFTVGGFTTKVTEYTIEGNRIIFDYRKLKPCQIVDDIHAVIYGTFNGKVYTGEVNYGVHTYVTNMLNKSAGVPEKAAFRTLLVDLMKYAAASQVYTNYKVDTLATALLTPEQLAEGTQGMPELVSVTDPNFKVIDAPSTFIKSASLNLRDSVRLAFSVEATDLTGLEVQLVVSGVTYTIPASEFTPDAKGRENRYDIVFDKLNAAAMRNTVDVTLVRDGVAVSNTLRYSIESYAAKYATRGDALADLCIAVMHYGDSAKAYVG